MSDEQQNPEPVVQQVGTVDFDFASGAYEEALRESEWIEIEEGKFGRLGARVRVQVRNVGTAYGDAYRGHQNRQATRIPKRKLKEWQIMQESPVTADPEVSLGAARFALKKTGAIQRVEIWPPAIPSVDRPDAFTQRLFGGAAEVPASIARRYKEADGMWRIPLDGDMVPELAFNEQMIEQCLEDTTFLSEVGLAVSRLAEPDEEAMEDDAGNSVSG